MNTNLASNRNLDKGDKAMVQRTIRSIGEQLSYVFAIKINKDEREAVCSICNGRVHLSQPPAAELFLEDHGLVCAGCGQRHAPELKAILDTGKQGNALIERLIELNDKQQQQEEVK